MGISQVSNIQSPPVAGFSPVGGTGGTPHELYAPLITAVSPHKIQKLSPSPIFVDHDKKFFRYFLNLCMTKANLTSITS